MWQRLKTLVDDRVIRPMRESHSPIDELAMGTAIGVLWALTPLVGVQMPLATLSWFVFRLFGRRFNLPIALAWVWISNPVTMPIFYYTFYLAGIVIYEVAGISRTVVSFDSVKQVIDEANNMAVMDGVWHWTNFMLESMGWPMMVGCLVFCIPLAIIGYPITARMVNDFRRRKAAAMNLSLEEWEARYVYKTVPIGNPANASVQIEAVADPAPAPDKKSRSASSGKSGGRRKKKSAKAASRSPNAKKSRSSGKKTKAANKSGDSAAASKKNGRKSRRAAFKAGPATA